VDILVRSGVRRSRFEIDPKLKVTSAWFPAAKREMSGQYLNQSYLCLKDERFGRWVAKRTRDVARGEAEAFKTGGSPSDD
jgi:hypothetical protein